MRQLDPNPQIWLSPCGARRLGVAEAAVPARLLPPPCQTRGFTPVLIPFLQPAPVRPAPGRDVRGGPKPQLLPWANRGTGGQRCLCPQLGTGHPARDGGPLGARGGQAGSPVHRSPRSRARRAAESGAWSAAQLVRAGGPGGPQLLLTLLPLNVMIKLPFPISADPSASKTVGPNEHTAQQL